MNDEPGRLEQIKARAAEARSASSVFREYLSAGAFEAMASGYRDVEWCVSEIDRLRAVAMAARALSEALAPEVSGETVQALEEALRALDGKDPSAATGETKP